MVENPIVIKARKAFIIGSKCFPFMLCLLIALSYLETIFALATNDFIIYDGYLIPNVPISWFIGEYFEYQIPFVLALIVIVHATNTCIWNKLCCYYSFIALIEKSYFDFELDIWQIYIIAIANLIVSGYFTYKGIRILIK